MNRTERGENKGVFINKQSEGAGLEFSQTSKKVVTHQKSFFKVMTHKILSKKVVTH